MIAGATRGVGGAALARHLSKTAVGQQVLVMLPRGLAAETLKGQIAELVADAAHGRTARPVHHIHVDPPPEASNPNEIIGTFLRHYETEFGLRHNQRCGVFHLKDGRQHAHVVYSLVGEDGRVADLRHEYARREKISRITEFECGLPMVKGKHNRAVAKALRQEGRADIADAMGAAGLLEGRRPVAHSTPRQRAQAERTGVPLDEIRNQVLAAWRASDDAKSFAIALHAWGTSVATGDRGLILVDCAGGTHSLNRTLATAARAAGVEKITAAAVKQRLAGIAFPSAEDLRNGRAERRDPDPQGSGRSAPAAAYRTSQIDVQDINAAKGAIMKAIKAQNYKAELLEKIAPKGFDAHAFVDDLRMIKMPSPGNAMSRILMNDGGWIELDSRNATVRTWGPVGRAQVLAVALAAEIGCEVEHLAKSAGFSADADTLKVTRLSEDQIKDLAAWWTARGYSATSAPDGCWVNVGRSRIHDTDDRLEIHGTLTDEAIVATILKAREAWDGGVYLDGYWTQHEQDRMWIAAQRAGIEIQNCKPSASAQAAWQREQEAVATTTRTISAARSAVAVAADVKAAAGGDLEALDRLPKPLQAFVASYLDDDDCKKLSAEGVAFIIPELDRFRRLGSDELAEFERTDRTFTVPKPQHHRRIDNKNDLEL